MSYVPLKNSPLWGLMERKASLFPEQHASRLDYLFSTLQTSGGDGLWHDGHLSDLDDVVREYGAEIEDPPYLGSYWNDPGNFLSGASATDPAGHRLFAAIPAVPATYELGQSDLSETAPALQFPLQIDVHDLAATAMLLKHLWQNPQRLQDSPLVTAAEKHAMAGKGLNICLEIAEARGLEEDFSRSCAEFAEHLPALAAPTEARQDWLQRPQDDVDEMIERARALINQRWGHKPS